MIKYLFLQLIPSLVTSEQIENSIDIDIDKLPYDYKSIINLNQVMKDNENIVIVLIGANISMSKEIQKFVLNKFEYPDRIVGQVLDPLSILVKTEYDDMGLDRFPITIGNCIKHWVDNFIESPYYIDSSLSKLFEVWETDEEGNKKYVGMRKLKLGIEYDYVICSNGVGLLHEQISKNILIDRYGFTTASAKRVLLG